MQLKMELDTRNNTVVTALKCQKRHQRFLSNPERDKSKIKCEEGRKIYVGY
jgi:hypothetical protein